MFRFACYGAILALLSCLTAASAAAESDRAVYVELRPESADDDATRERWKLYSASYALVIGIDDYRVGWPRLSNAVGDAKAVAAALQARGFEVTTLFNPVGDKLRSELRSFFALKGSDPEARLFVWFAGHGYTEFGEGYLVPTDAPDPSDPAFLLRALHLGDVGSMVRIARSKHVFAVFDSCFAGTIFNASRARPPAAITRAVSEPVRQFLTSGDADQQVSDDGAFRRLFLKALGGEEDADANDDGYLTGTELSLFLEDRVVNLTQSLQTPRSGKLRDQRFDQGDFVFLLPQRVSRQVAVAEPQAGSEAATRALPAGDPELAVELAFWDAIKASDSPDDYKAYLTAYPEGRFTVLAESRVARLEPAAAAREAEHARLEAEARARSADEQHHQAEDREHHQAEAAQNAQLAALPAEPQVAPQAAPAADPALRAEESLGLTRGDRRELQAALTALGFDTRGIDGVFGPGTRNAIRGYQAAKGNEQNGYLTASLVGSLRAEAPRTPAGTTQTAARPPQPAISKNAANDYLRANASAMKRDLMNYNQKHRVILGSYGGTAERLDILSWRVEQLNGDEAVVAVAYREPIVVLAGNSGTQRFLLKWDGSGFSFIGHQSGGAMRRTGN